MQLDDNPIMDPKKCKHRNAYFVDTVGEEYCPDCDEWTGVCD